MEHAQSLGAGATAQARPEPTTTFDDRLELSIGGRQLVLLSTPGGETTDSLVIWLPESRTAFTGNLFGPLFGHVPNLVTMRGDRYRDALAYVDSLDLVLDLAPEPAAHRPLRARSTAPTASPRRSTAMRDATQWVHDRTVDGHERRRRRAHPDARDPRCPSASTWARATARRRWNVRAIWENYAGWFHHRSTTELYDVSRRLRSRPTSWPRPAPTPWSTAARLRASPRASRSPRSI